jgi:hypothetical protein
MNLDLKSDDERNFTTNQVIKRTGHNAPKQISKHILLPPWRQLLMRPSGHEIAAKEDEGVVQA